jgi:hypothetical protein
VSAKLAKKTTPKKSVKATVVIAGSNMRMVKSRGFYAARRALTTAARRLRSTQAILRCG